jgi:hypothetical protein
MPVGDTIECNECHFVVPALDYCVRCGDPLDEEKRARAKAGITGRRTHFVARPEESAFGVHVVSTLFPQLPRSDMGTFRAVLAIGLVTIIGLAVLGFFPLALIAAALLVPLIMVLYVWDVDVYEDEPLRVLAFTAAWGVVTGVIVGLVLSRLPSGASIAGASGVVTMSDVAQRSVLVPLVSGILMLAGPVILLRYRKFNDVLDGATFGATSAVAFTAALVLSQAADVFASGLRPAGDSLPWIVRLLSLGIATPLIAAGVIGAATGAFWLQYRAPVRDRSRLGFVGRPFIATALALLILVASALGAQLLAFVPALLWQGLLAVIALIWLRAVIHLGLLEEAAEIEIGPPIRCPNCGRPTPWHSFCGFCGTSLRAMPKSGAAAGAGATPTGAAGPGPTAGSSGPTVRPDQPA